MSNQMSYDANDLEN